MAAMSEQVSAQENWDQVEPPPSARWRAGKVGPGEHSEQTRRRLAILARTIQAEVVPRLVLARRAAPAIAALVPVVAGAVCLPDQSDVAALAALVLGPDEAAGSAYLAAMQARGIGLDSLYLDLLAPAARLLGDFWTEDVCDFTQVTTGLLRLQNVLHDFSAAFVGDVPRPGQGKRILLLPAPGDQHSFGLSMVVEFFRRAGWSVHSGFLASGPELAVMVRSRFVSVVGFSVSCTSRLDALAGSIRMIRRASRNPAIGIMVGGPVFLDHPELVATVGADATATDGRQAVLQAQNLLALLPARG